MDHCQRNQLLKPMDYSILLFNIPSVFVFILIHFLPWFSFFFPSVHSQQIAQHLPFPTFIGSSAIKYKQNNENMKSMDEES